MKIKIKDKESTILVINRLAKIAISNPIFLGNNRRIQSTSLAKKILTIKVKQKTKAMGIETLSIIINLTKLAVTNVILIKIAMYIYFHIVLKISLK